MRKTNFTKMEKKITVLAMAGLLIFGFTGCGGNNSEKNYDIPDNTPDDQETDDQKTEHNAGSTDLLSFNISSKTQYLATQFAAGTLDSAKAKKPKSGSVDSEDTLIAVVISSENESSGNNKVKEEKVISVPRDELKLADWCKPQPVREIYKCPYTTVEEQAKGVYTVFADRIDWWQYEDGTPAPHIGQILYVKPDGTKKDILNFNNDVARWICTWIKENDGEEYIQFDENGNIYILAEEESTRETIVYRYNPLNDEVKPYKVEVNGKLRINNFKITRNGKWIFLNAMIDQKINNVYALQVNSNAKPITMYEFDSKASSDKPTWAVSSLGINPVNDSVYWYVCEYNSTLFPNSGLYVATKSSNGSYSKENVKRYYGIARYNIDNAIREYVTNASNPDYTSLLNYLKSQCGYNGEIELSLAGFKDMEKLDKSKVKNPWSEYFVPDQFVYLYKTDEAGNPLKNEDALKYLIETKWGDVIPNLDEYEKNEWFYEQKEKSIWDSILWDFEHYYYYYSLYGNDFYSEETGFKFAHFPLQYMMFKKGTTESAYVMNETYANSIHAQKVGGILLTNDDGMWVYGDVWDDEAPNPLSETGKGNNIYAEVLNLTNIDGTFTMKQPDGLDKMKFHVNKDNSFEREETDPWFKSPFEVNTKGFAAISLDQKTIWYHTNGKTKDLLEHDSNKGSIGTIYSFSLDDEKLIYNAIKTNGGFMMVSVDLATGEATKLPIDKQLESMMSL